MKNSVVGIAVGTAAILGLTAVVGSSVLANTSTTEVNVACIQGKVSERDLRIQDAFDSYYDIASAALSDRTEDINQAWSIADRNTRRTALRDAYRAYKTSIKDARAEFKRVRLRAWETFRYERVLCGSRVTDESGSSGNDGSL